MDDQTVITPASDIGSVLFACNINAVRSAMAEAIVKSRFPGKIFTDSCGVTPGQPDGFAISVMGEIDIDLSQHAPKGFGDLDCDFYDVIISFSPEAHARAQDAVIHVLLLICVKPVDEGDVNRAGDCRLPEQRWHVEWREAFEHAHIHGVDRGDAPRNVAATAICSAFGFGVDDNKTRRWK